MNIVTEIGDSRGELEATLRRRVRRFALWLGDIVPVRVLRAAADSERKNPPTWDTVARTHILRLRRRNEVARRVALYRRERIERLEAILSEILPHVDDPDLWGRAASALHQGENG